MRRFVARASLFSGGGDQCCEQDDKLNKMKSTGRLNILVNTTFELLFVLLYVYISLCVAGKMRHIGVEG